MNSIHQLQSLDKSIQGQVNKLEELCAKEEKEHKSRIVEMEDDTKVCHTRLGRFTGFSGFFGFILKPVCFGLAFTKTGKPSLPNCLLSSPETRFFPLSFRDFSVLYNYAIKILFFFCKVGKN